MSLDHPFLTHSMAFPLQRLRSQIDLALRCRHVGKKNCSRSRKPRIIFGIVADWFQIALLHFGAASTFSTVFHPKKYM